VIVVHGQNQFLRGRLEIEGYAHPSLSRDMMMFFISKKDHFFLVTDITENRLNERKSKNRVEFK
jgi:hypothetical protein